jgi:hypothetical protein
MTKGFNEFSSFPARQVILPAALPIVIVDTRSSQSPEFSTIPEEVTLALTKFRKRLAMFIINFT